MLFWLHNIFRDTPTRAGRLLGTFAELTTITKSEPFVVWLHSIVIYFFDLLGGPEILQSVIRTLTITRTLTGREVETAKLVFGDMAIRYRDIRVAHGGIWQIIFMLNSQRAFTTWHTINIPNNRMHDASLVIHELTHVYQFEKVGSIYIGQGLWAQFRLGSAAYDYGGADGLSIDSADGKHYSDYNREQQGQIAQDYCSLLLAGQETVAYEPFINELRSGAM